MTFVKYRFLHHAAPSGYSRLCDYLDAPRVELSNLIHLLGETLLRPFCLYQAKRGGKYEYSRYDCSLELQLLLDAVLRERSRIYHFIYCEKSFHLCEYFHRSMSERGHRLVGTVHHMPEQQSWLFKSHKHFKLFDALITMDERSIDYWRGVTGRDNVFWVPNGVDTNYFTPNPAEKTSRRVLFAGTHERDFETLATTVTLLSKDHDFHFDLIGNSAALKALEREFENVTLYSRLSDEQYRQVLQNASLLLLPLHSSTFCNVVLESMACGLPVVTTQGGIEAYLDDACALTSPAGDAVGLVRQVREMAGKLPSASAVARHRAEMFSWSEVARKHLDFYSTLVR